MAQDVDVFIGGPWEGDGKRFLKLLDDMVAQIDRLEAKTNTLRKSLRFDFEDNSKHKKNIQEAIKLQGEYTDANKSTAQAILNLNNARKVSVSNDIQETRSKKELLQAQRELLAEKIKYKALIEKESAELKKNLSEYQKLNAEAKKAERIYKDVAAAKGVDSAEAKKLAEASLYLNNRLKEIDATIGDNKRNVGNYKSHWNAMGGAMQQISRELPNFAQSWEIGFRSITNNIGAVIDAGKQVREENKKLRAEGKETQGVFTQMMGGLFNWQTALLLVVGYLATNFDAVEAKVTELLNPLNSLDRVTKDIQKAQKESAESTAREMAEAQKLVTTLQSNTASRAEILEAIEKVKAAYPEYLGFITEENRLSNEVTEALKNQIDFIRQKALSNSFQEAYTKALTRLQEAEADYTALLSSKNQKLWKINEAQKELKKSIEDVRTAYDLASNPVKALTARISEQIKKDQDLHNAAVKKLEDLKKAGKASSDYAKILQGEINRTQILIHKNNEYIDTIERIFSLKKGEGNVNALSPAEIKQKNIEAQLLLAKNGSKQELDLSIQNEKAKNDVAINELKDRYIKEHNLREEDLANNESYQTELKLQNANTLNSIERLKESYYKKTSPKRGGGSMTNESLAAEKMFTKEYYEEIQKRAENEAEAASAIAEDESQSLSDRLLAYRKYIKEREKAAASGLDAEYMETLYSLRKISELETKKSGGGKLANEDKALLLKKEAFEQKLLNIEKQYSLLSERSERESLQGIEKIQAESVSLRLSQISHLHENIQAQEQQAQKDLQLLYEKGGMSFEDYKKQSANLASKYAKKALLETIEYLEEEIRLLAAAGVNVTAMLTALNNAKAKVYDDDKKNYLKTEEEKAAYFKNLNDLIWNATSETIKMAFDLRAAYFSAEIERHEKEKELIDERLSLELKAIQIKAKNKEEADKLSYEAEAKAFSAKKIQEAEISRIKRRAALAERAARVLGIVGNTAEGVARQFKDFGMPYALIPAGIVAGLGALQVAAVLAQPLPQYYKGTESAQKGWAHVAERGPEIVIGKNGPELVEIPSIKYMEGGEKVVTADKTREMLASSVKTKPIDEKEKAKYYADQLQGQILQNALNTDKIVRAIRSQKPVVFEGVSLADADYVKAKRGK